MAVTQSMEAVRKNLGPGLRDPRSGTWAKLEDPGSSWRTGLIKLQSLEGREARGICCCSQGEMMSRTASTEHWAREGWILASLFGYLLVLDAVPSIKSLPTALWSRYSSPSLIGEETPGHMEINLPKGQLESGGARLCVSSGDLHCPYACLCHWTLL